MADDVVLKVADSAKDALAKATRLTENVTGNPTNAFAPKKLEVPRLPQAKPSYSLAHINTPK